MPTIVLSLMLLQTSPTLASCQAEQQFLKLQLDQMRQAETERLQKLDDERNREIDRELDHRLKPPGKQVFHSPKVKSI